METEDEGYETL